MCDNSLDFPFQSFRTLYLDSRPAEELSRAILTCILSHGNLLGVLTAVGDGLGYNKVIEPRR